MAEPITNRQVAAILYEVADLLEMKDVRFKPVAYRRAARGIETLAEDIGRVAERGELEDLPGIGTHIAAKLREILSTGKLGYLERLKAEVGPGVRELAEIGGIGPKKAMLLHQKLGIGNPDQLEAAARAGKIRELAGFGEKSEANILAGIAMHRQQAGRSLLGRMLPVAESIRSRLAALPAVKQVSLAGSLRRMKETIGDIDILASSAEPDAVMAAFTAFPEVTRILGRGITKSSVLIDPGVQVDLRVVEEGQFGAALQYFTGSKDHNIALRRRAISRGWSLSEYGLKDDKTGKNLAGSTEEDLYRTLGLPPIEPELRENRGEIEAAEGGTLPAVIPYNGLQGDLHVHSDWSDGKDTIRTLALAAKERGYGYIAICDHSRSPGIERGLDPAKTGEQRAVIEQLNRELGDFTVLQGIECSVGTDGTPDLPPAVLGDLDIVIASVHDNLRMHGEEMTHRVLNAIQNEHVDILGHPTGRLLLRRDPSDLNLPEVFKAAAGQDTALEINSSPSRLDLPDTECRKARDAGAVFSIGSDAHGQDELAEIRLGIATARRGWLTPKDIVNSRSLKDLERWLGK
jgi:DNA polymerase (family X)